ncbi:MAG: DUF2442 domain-containing protein [Planctomycetota bacterium]
MHHIVKVKPLAHFKVWLKFSDGVEGTVDLSELAGKGVFEAWNEPKVFDSIFIDPVSHTIAWPGGIDLCPDSLYAEVSGRGTLATKGEKCPK